MIHHNFGQILGMKSIQNISLYSRTYRLLSNFSNEKIKVLLERNFPRNGYNDIKKKKKNCQLKNYGNNTGAEYDGKRRTKNKCNSGFEEKKLLRKGIYILFCPPLGNLVLGENSQSFQQFMTKSGMQAFLLSLFILSITMVIYILVKFINYVIEVGGDEIKN
ncbi:hypothetical protein PMALA_072890 [Plasmodium malariae]|uniref:Uncharacterized protein n=1 Tax=Plasmodium malariae TaxID=5858 RepID=A0A1A8X7Y3_PLAMA|nr:hypothetical protein PMALA_072890 [Plasmodium malariae]